MESPHSVRVLLHRWAQAEHIFPLKKGIYMTRNFQCERAGAFIKRHDFYNLLWFMQKGVQPLTETLAQDAKNPHTVSTAVQVLAQKVSGFRTEDLAVDLLPMFESRSFIESWLENFHSNFERFSKTNEATF